MRYVKGVDRDQTLLLPESFDQYVREENPVRFIDAFVDNLDFVKLGFKYATTKACGRKPYSPADMLKLYLYGYLNRIRSSRRLEQATHRNIELIWLLRKLHPDFKTIADFRKDNAKAIKKVCREFTLLCKKLDLFGCELIAIDGSKFSADNHNSRTYTKKKLQRLLAEIDEKIDAYLKGLDQEDQAEFKLKNLTTEELQNKIENLQSHRSEIEQIQKQLETSGEKQISLTDPDSRMMATSQKGKDVCYNVQIVTDSKHKLIVEHEVTNDCNDTHQLSNMAIKAKETLGVDEIDTTADSGYFEKEEVKKCQANNITCYIPTPAKSQNKKIGLYTDKDFHYDAENDCYICPADQVLTYRFQMEKSKKKTKVYTSDACKGCAFRSKCTRSHRHARRIYRWLDQNIIEEMEQRISENPDKVKKRKELVEHPFGTIKHWMNGGHFLTRGLRKVSAEMSLNVLCYNLKRVINIMGVQELVNALA
jgi:transposase